MSYMGSRIRRLDASLLAHVQAPNLEGTVPIPDLPLVIDEIPAGPVNGINDTFTLAHVPVGGLQLELDGLDLVQDVHYTLVGAIITFLPVFVPQVDERLTASYEY